MHGTTSASIVEVIRVIETVGDGREIPARQVISYWTKEGELITRQDPICEVQSPEPPQ